MKKKVISIALVIALIAVIAAGSFAYFTDTKSATNTFTVGNVNINLIEQQTGENGLEKFDQNKPLVPGKSNDGNAVSKIVTVENTGANDAWVWVDIKVPTVLVSKDINSASKETFNALHWNSYGHFTTAYNEGGKYIKSPIADGIIDDEGNVTNTDMVAVADGLWNDFEYVGIDGDYTVFRAKMVKTLAPGKISLPCLRQVYMDWRINANADGSWTFPQTNDGTYSYAGAEIPAGTDWKIIVNAYAIQADGIDSVDKAIEAYANNGK